MASPEAQPAQVVFRPGKKRKAYRHRPEEEEPVIAEGATNSLTASSATGVALDDDSDQRSVAGALRLRNARKNRHGGVAFRAGPFLHGDGGEATDTNPDRSMVLHDTVDGSRQDDSAILGGITQRFAPQTGLVGELVNKHM